VHSDKSFAPYVVKQVKGKDTSVAVDDLANREQQDESDQPSSRMSGGGLVLGAGEAGGEQPQRVKTNNQISSREIPKPAAKRAPIPDPVVVETEVTDEMIEQAMERSYEGDSTVTGSLIPRADLTVLSPVDLAQAQPQEELGRKDQRLNDLKENDGPAPPDSSRKNGDKLRTLGDDVLESLNRPVGTEEAAGRRPEESRLRAEQLEKNESGFKRDSNKYRKKISETEEFETEGGKTFADADVQSSISESVDEVDDNALSAARRFLDNRDRIEDLDFVEARGYWANTYVPGDRTLRQLKARLDRADGARVTGTLHDDARQISQPFDPPDAAALAVYLHGDRTGVEARERMLVQIGLKATSRRAGVRPAMNVGLVLDLRGQVETEEATEIRALLQAFAAASELGDRFSLTVAGRPGGTILPPGDLRHGPLTVAMGELFADDAKGTALTLEQAIATAMVAVRADEDPNAALGSSALVVITAQELGGLTSRLAHMAHLCAVDGVPWSVIGVGEGVDLAELDALVLAGQGNRRLLTSAADAEALVDRELAAVSRAVARAVRLRIRLAPGVQLVDVIGSQRLDERRAQQVRDAEQSIDQRLSRNLGIQADRGLDEDGIQIVIPSYFADNAHVVLLDVVVPGPGPVADVTIRYKDLVHMKNGVARARLEVGRSASALGPLEQNVLANLVATEVASNLDDAADAVAVGDLDTAGAILTEALELVRGITGMVDGLAQNPDLEADMKMLAGYLQALATLSADAPAQLQTAADSLRYAGRLKVLPPPVDDDEIE